ncbi:MAG: SMC-Scp complex subunit ScpB [Clostridia bacterium]|nr:SMC-Scp complex subunit ScpB [Clostridia bacterium]
MNHEELIGIIENLLFMAGESVSIREISRITGMSFEEVSLAVDEEIRRREEGHGLLLQRFDDNVQLATRKEYSEYIVELLGEKTEEELSNATLETLSIIAYKQPVTRDEIEKIRGVSCSYTINALLDRKLIYVAGRRDTLGKPKLYCTTEDFLRYFNISSVEELPPIENEEEQLTDNGMADFDIPDSEEQE